MPDLEEKQREKLNKLKNILTMMDENLSRAEFVEAFKNLISIVKKAENDLTEKHNKTIKDLAALFTELKGKLENTTNSELSRVIEELEGYLQDP